MHELHVSTLVYDFVSIVAVTIPVLAGLAGAGVIRPAVRPLVLALIGSAIWEVHVLPLMINLVTSFEPDRIIVAAFVFGGIALLSTVAPFAMGRALVQRRRATSSGLVLSFGYCLDLCLCAGFIGWDIATPGPVLALSIIETLAAVTVPLYLGFIRKPAIVSPRLLLTLVTAALAGSYLGYGVSFATGLSTLR